jgi:hypothetical protein
VALKFAIGVTVGQLQSTEPQRTRKANMLTNFNFKVILTLDTYETSFELCRIYTKTRECYSGSEKLLTFL